MAMQLEPHHPVYTSVMAESLVALRDRREQVISRLSDGYARDLFDVEELERRLDLAHGARSVADLDQLVADLGEPGPGTAKAGAPPRGAPALRVSSESSRTIDRRSRVDWRCPADAPTT